MKKIFSWLRNGNEGSNTSNPQPKSYDHQSCKEEFWDWPNGLLAIGTFGNNNNLKHSEEADKSSSAGVVLEEVDKELRLLLNTNHISADQLFNANAHLERINSTSVHSHNKSLSSLIKKALLCGAAAPPPPIFRDPLPHPKSDLSRMEKILRAMLHKKIYPQRPTQKKYLEEEGNHRSKWVKTDSECK